MTREHKHERLTSSFVKGVIAYVVVTFICWFIGVSPIDALMCGVMLGLMIGSLSYDQQRRSVVTEPVIHVCAVCGRLRRDDERDEGWSPLCSSHEVACKSGTLVRAGSPDFRVLRATTVSGRVLTVDPSKHSEVIVTCSECGSVCFANLANIFSILDGEGMCVIRKEDRASKVVTHDS